MLCTSTIIFGWPGPYLEMRRFRFARTLVVEAGGLELSAWVAESFAQRLLGLAGLPAIPARRGLLIPGCASVHTWGMRFAIDIAFLAWPPGRGQRRAAGLARRSSRGAGPAARAAAAPAALRCSRRPAGHAPGLGHARLLPSGHARTGRDRRLAGRAPADPSAGRAPLRAILASYVGGDPACARLRARRPRQARPARARARIQLLAVGRVGAALAVSRDRPVGVDVERVKPGRAVDAHRAAPVRARRGRGARAGPERRPRSGLPPLLDRQGGVREGPRRRVSRSGLRRFSVAALVDGADPLRGGRHGTCSSCPLRRARGGGGGAGVRLAAPPAHPGGPRWLSGSTAELLTRAQRRPAARGIRAHRAETTPTASRWRT